MYLATLIRFRAASKPLVCLLAWILGRIDVLDATGSNELNLEDRSFVLRAGTKCFYQRGTRPSQVVVVNAAYLEQHVPFVRARRPPASAAMTCPRPNWLGRLDRAVAAGLDMVPLAGRGLRV